MIFSTILKVIPGEKRASLVYVFILMMISMVLETLSIGLVVPAISFITRPDAIMNSEFMTGLLVFLNNPDQNTLVLYGMLALVTAYFIKTIFLTYFVWKQNQFSYSLLMDLSEEMYRGYLRMPWEFHIAHNSAVLLRNITIEVTSAVNNILIPVIRLTSECFVVAGIGILLLIVEPIGSLTVMFILIVVGFVFQKISRGKISRWGNERQLHEGKRVQQLQEGLGAAKEIKLLYEFEAYLFTNPLKLF